MKPAARLCLSSGESGSVTMTIWFWGARPAFVNASSKSARCEAVSIVEPDLELTTTTVFAKSALSAWAT